MSYNNNYEYKLFIFPYCYSLKLFQLDNIFVTVYMWIKTKTILLCSYYIRVINKYYIKCFSNYSLFFVMYSCKIIFTVVIFVLFVFYIVNTL